MTAHRVGGILEQNMNNDEPWASWSADDLRLLRDMWAAGATLAAIAARLGRSAEAVRSRARRLRLSPRRARRDTAAAPAGRERPCLNCATRFVSQGPHNRLGDPCRERDDGDFRLLSHGTRR